MKPKTTKAPKIHFLFKPPESCYLAFSGGVDSVVLLHLLLNKGYDVTLLNVDHGNEFARQEVEFCVQTANKLALDYVISEIPIYDKETSLEAKRTSREAFWSKYRNDVFQSMDKPVFTAHHLSDAVTWWVMSTMQGCPKLLNYSNRNIFRPLLGTTKKQILEYANYHNLTYLTDPTNDDPDYCLRNKVNHLVMGGIKTCFPGVEKTVKRLIQEKEARLKEEI